MRALTVCQPWAWAIVHAGKNVENRTWQTRYRGPIWIHAGAALTRAYYEDSAAELAELGVVAPPREELALEHVIGRARLVNVVTESPSPWFGGPFGWALEDVEPVAEVRCRGAIGLWTPPPEVCELLRQHAPAV